jgi:isopentenyldiphosphate isomerase
MKAQIVDENDNIIGLKERDQIDHQNDIYRVTSLWLTNSKGEILLAHRSPEKRNDPNTWGSAVAGTIEEDESYDENIYKEAMEEIGLNGVVFTKGPKTRVSYPRNYFCQWYFVEIDREIESFVMQPEEVDALTWISMEEFLKDLRNKPDKYVPAMPQIIEQLFPDIKY